MTVLLPKDYLRFALTGEKLTDMSDAAGTWLLDEARRRWSAAALPPAVCRLRCCRRCRKARRRSPRCGRASPTRLGFRAAPSSRRAAATPRSARSPRRDPTGRAPISLGTASQLIIASDFTAPLPKTLVHSFAHALPDLWYRMAAMLTAPARSPSPRDLPRRTSAELEREAAEHYRGPGEVVFLPYLSGERTPLDDPYARGVAFGFSPASTRADFTRAVMEGVALTLADARQCLEAAGDSFSHIGLIGGGARSALWTRMIAAAVDREIVRYHGGEKGPAFGAARLARIAATGETPQSVCHPLRSPTSTPPEPALVEAFARRRERFHALYQALKDEFAAAARRQP